MLARTKDAVIFKTSVPLRPSTAGKVGINCAN